MQFSFKAHNHPMKYYYTTPLSGMQWKKQTYKQNIKVQKQNNVKQNPMETAFQLTGEKINQSILMLEQLAIHLEKQNIIRSQNKPPQILGRLKIKMFKIKGKKSDMKARNNFFLKRDLLFSSLKFDMVLSSFSSFHPME